MKRAIPMLKKTPDTTNAVSSAQSKRKFSGTTNQRHIRAINALLNGPITRHNLAQVAGAANAPELVAELRRRGLTIPCERFDFTDRDGDKCRPGEYSLTEDDRRMVLDWVAVTAASEVLL